jgi:hypothetical protein
LPLRASASTRAARALVSQNTISEPPCGCASRRSSLWPRAPREHVGETAPGENGRLWAYRERKSAGESAPVAASGPVSPGNYPLYFRARQGPPNNRDCMAVDAVRCEPVSGCLQARTGNFRVLMSKQGAQADERCDPIRILTRLQRLSRCNRRFPVIPANRELWPANRGRLSRGTARVEEGTGSYPIGAIAQSELSISAPCVKGVGPSVGHRRPLDHVRPFAYSSPCSNSQMIRKPRRPFPCE